MSDATKPEVSAGTTIRLEPYDPVWPAQFETEAVRIGQALAAAALAIHHAGSTSVPGLAAKPILDIILVVADSTDEASYCPALEAAAYRFHHREPHWFEHRLLKRDAPQVNLHVFSRDCPEIARMLTFRDWLRAHPEDRRRYETVKQELARQVWRTTQDYADAKSAVVAEILGRALA
jgi:GrpB-like predicted nucleotidyltransferase (UPF0157 family)